MRDIREVYPPESDGEFPSYPSNYGALVESIGHEVLVRVDDEDYSGDSRYLLADGARRGYLEFGWGSCSGCDALQACDSYDAVEKLRTSLVESIRWFDDARAALIWFSVHDWEGDYASHSDKQAEFIRQATERLTKDAAP
jgi:hypothetical protein